MSVHYRDGQRIAAALERIAAALERQAGFTANNKDQEYQHRQKERDEYRMRTDLMAAIFQKMRIDLAPTARSPALQKIQHGLFRVIWMTTQYPRSSDAMCARVAALTPETALRMLDMRHGTKIKSQVREALGLKSNV